ncbi:unnamed protein product, partial [Brachionus calyciflorus]
MLDSEDDDDSSQTQENSNIVLSNYSKKKQIALNNKLIDFIVGNNLPISIVKSEEFKVLFKEACPSYILPCRQTITQNLIPEKYECIKQKLSLELRDLRFVSLTTDCWTSNSNNPYLCVTVHFVNSNFQFVSRLLCLEYLEQEHKADYLNEKLDSIIKDWNLDEKVFKIVADSGSNIKSALTKRGWYVPCTAHKLNLSANDVLREKKIKIKYDKNGNDQYYIKDFDDDGVLRQKEITYEEAKILESVNIFKKDLNEIISKVRKLVGSFKHSYLLTKNLREKQEIMNYETKIKLIQEVPTRWNSTFDMIESVVLNKDAILSMSYESFNSVIKDKVPSHVEFTIIEEYCLLFEKIKDLTEILSGSNYTTISIVFPAIFTLVNYELDCLDLRTYEIKKLKTELVNSLKGRFSFVLNSDLYLAATFLNIKYKNLTFVKDLKLRESYLTRAKQFIIDIYNENFNTRQSQISSSPLSNISNSTPISSESSSSNISSIGNRSSTQQSLILEEKNLPNTPVSSFQNRSRSKKQNRYRKDNFLNKI